MAGQFTKSVNLQLDNDWPVVLQFDFTKASLTQIPYVPESARLGSGDWVRGGSFRNGGPCLGTRPSKLRFAVPKVYVERAVVSRAEKPKQKTVCEFLPLPPRLQAQLSFYMNAATWADNVWAPFGHFSMSPESGCPWECFFIGLPSDKFTHAGQGG